MLTFLALTFLTAVLGLDLIATHKVVTARWLKSHERRAELAFLWLVPIAGALLTLQMHGEDGSAKGAEAVREASQRGSTFDDGSDHPHDAASHRDDSVG